MSPQSSEKRLDAPPASAFERLSGMRGTVMPVVPGDELVGVLTAENVSEFLSVPAATDGRDGGQLAPNNDGTWVTTRVKPAN